MPIANRITRARQRHRRAGFRCTRNKGLGEMDVDELAESTLDPATRVLRRITMADAPAAQKAAEAVRGPHGQGRRVARDYIVANSALLDREALDI